jgi:hypothetical protein
LLLAGNGDGFRCGSNVRGSAAMTERDFADIGNVQLFLLTNDDLFLYEGKY